MLMTRMVKLQKQKAWKRGDETYFKWVVIIPEETIKRSGIPEGAELVAEIVSPGKISLREATNHELNVRKKKKNNIITDQITDSQSQKIKLSDDEKIMRAELIKLFEKNKQNSLTN